MKTPWLEGSSRAPTDQHRIAVAVEAIAPVGGFAIRAAREIDPRKGHHQSQQGRARKMEVGDEVVDHVELMRRTDEEPRRIEPSDWAAFSVDRRFERADDGGADRYNRPPFLTRATNGRDRRIRNFVCFFVHLVIVQGV